MLWFSIVMFMCVSMDKVNTTFITLLDFKGSIIFKWM
ncbi:hypothetical protein M758_12G170400 [Ceratodon purpureus]|uniref:Uncharacterized protein n=1 Tax=Ceratodon purpureus TaxID=3225 RepID=A0A8T0GDZ9_CERPU|nr:hypothetical protein KC19_12G168600 [Ceratodon purpureus]KAG0599676.1 hypothetical protein M758_12G170400 [Ceratodon purpureus]